jgi:hypothetical protein
MEKQSINVLGKLLLIVMVFVMFSPLIAQAAQDADARIEKLEAAVQALQAELKALKAERAAEKARAPKPAPVVDKRQLEQLVSKTFEEKKDEMGVVPDWVKNIKFSGDIRYRHETIDAQTAGSWGLGRNRHRVRARLQLDAKVNDEVDAVIRIASGSADPTSANQTLDNSFSSKELWLDLAAFDWHPESMEGLNFIGGKMKNPFYRVGKNQVIWDSDLNPEGLAAKYVVPFGVYDKIHINGGGFWVDESSGADIALWGMQTYLKHQFEDESSLVGGVSYFDYDNIQGATNLASRWGGTANAFGNTPTVPGGTIFANDYNIFEAFGEYVFHALEMPMAVFGNYATNTAVSAKNNAWIVGGKINKAKDPGSWEAGYSYRDVDADAVVGQFNDSDFLGGSTNGRGHKFGFKYQLHKNLQAALTLFLNEAKNATTDDYRRLQADLIFKF